MDGPKGKRTGFYDASVNDDRNVNWQMAIRSLVIDGGMDFNTVLDLNPRQIAALCMEKTQSPGLLKPEMLRAGIANLRRREYGG